MTATEVLPQQTRRAKIATDTAPNVFLGMPTYDGRAESESVSAACLGATQGLCRVRFEWARSSLLALGFNMLWAKALNMAAQGQVNRFAMLHADIAPAPGWLDLLERTLQEYDLDVVSCVVPLKDMRGVTSTGIGDPLDEWAAPVRTTIRDLERLPDVFDARHYGRPDDPLYINTGCWLARLDRGNWPQQTHFTIKDRLVHGQEIKPQVIPEDWGFSRQLWTLGVRYAATSRVKLLHIGPQKFAQVGEPWGAWHHDEQNDPQAQTRPVSVP